MNGQTKETAEKIEYLRLLLKEQHLTLDEIHFQPGRKITRGEIGQEKPVCLVSVKAETPEEKAAIRLLTEKALDRLLKPEN